MITDGLKTGDLVEMRWRQRSLSDDSTDRYLKMVLLNPVLTNIGTMKQRLAGWNCHVFYDTHHRRKGVLPYSKHYEINWLKTCERQGNLKIISASEYRESIK